MLTFPQLLEKARSYQQINDSRLEKAYLFAKQAHRGQKRKKGEAFIVHPLKVAFLLTDYFADEDSIIAALLHDTVEDTDVSLGDIQKNFGRSVAHLIDGLTKVLTDFSRDAKDHDRKIESLRKIFDVMTRDVRIGIIKMVDRLHNMQTLSSHENRKKEEEIARQTLEVYIKLANHLGMWRIKRKLENLVFPYVYPDEHNKLQNYLKKKEPVIDTMFKKLKKEFLQFQSCNKVEDVVLQKKSYVQMYLDKLPGDDDYNLLIQDIVSVKVIVKNESCCYQILSDIHQRWSHQEGTFVDYIQTNKENGYRSLHTLVHVGEDTMLPIHIETKEMMLDNEYGIARYCFNQGQKVNVFSWFNRLKKLDRDSKANSSRFWLALKNDILQKKMLIHVGDKSVEVPDKSTVLDFCYYYYHSGANFVHAVEINARRGFFDQALKKGDNVKVSFRKDKTVSHNWLQSVHTEYAKSLIIKALKRKNRQEKIQVGRQILQKELDYYTKILVENLSAKQKRALCNEYGKKSLDGVLIMIGEGLIAAYEIITVLHPERKKNIWDFLKRKIFRNSDDFQKVFYLEIKGFLRKTQRLFGKLYGSMGHLNVELLVKHFSHDHDTNIYKIRAKVKTEDRTDLSKLIVLLERQEWVSEVKSLLSPRQKMKLFFWMALSVAFLFFGFAFLELCQEMGWKNIYIISLLCPFFILVPLLITNYNFLMLLRTYFVFMRNERYFLSIGFFINVFAVFVLGWKFLALEMDFNLFPLVAILTCSMLLISYKYTQFNNSLFLKMKFFPLSKKDWNTLKTKKIYGYALRILAVIIFGLLPLYVKYTAINDLSPLVRVPIISVFTALAAVFIFMIGRVAIFASKGKLALKRSSEVRHDIFFWGWVALSIFYWVFYNYSLLYTSATKVNLFINFAPIVVLIVAVILWRNRISYLKKSSHIKTMFLIFSVGIFGSILLVFEDFAQGVKGDIFALLLMLCDAFIIVMAIGHARKYVFHSSLKFFVHKTFLVAVLAIVLIAPLYFFSVLPLGDITGITAKQIWFLLIFSTVEFVGILITYEAYKYIDGVIGYLLFNISIVITFVFEVFTDKFPVTWYLVLGSLLVVTASILAEVFNSKCEKLGLGKQVEGP